MIIPKDKIKKIINESLINEISMDRFKTKHLGEPIGFAIITANRHEYSKKENKKRYNSLRKDYLSTGYRFIPLIGSYKEATRDPETGEEVSRMRVIEDTIFVPDRPYKEDAPDLFDFTKNIAKKYNQEAFIFRQTDENTIKAYEGNGTPTSWGGPWTDIRSVEKDSEFWSKLRKGSGRKETWELTEIRLKEGPKSWIEAMKRRSQGETW